MNDMTERSPLTSPGTGWGQEIDPPTPDDPVGHETVALLLDEVARLEAELRARDEAAAHVVDPPMPGPEGPGHGRLAELTAELAGRDETIAILLEQARLFEEAAAAQRAEWEQLVQWVEEVERRVEGQGAASSGELAAERRRHDADRAEWEAQSTRMRRELEALRAAPTGGAASVLEAELRQLRARCAALEHDADGLEPLRAAQSAAAREIERLRNELERAQDERTRERREAEAALAASRSELAQARLVQPPGAAPPTHAARTDELDPDERIRAFRQHLRELHDREAEQRAGRSLSSRLSRLWRHTGPG